MKASDFKKPLIAINIESIDQVLVLEKISHQIEKPIIIQISSRNIDLDIFIL